MKPLLKQIIATGAAFLCTHALSAPIKYFSPPKGMWGVGGMSRDASTVLGKCFDSGGNLAPFKWTPATNAFKTYAIPNSSGTYAYDASTNGNVVVGGDFNPGFCDNQGTLIIPPHTETFRGVSDNGLLAVGQDDNGNAISWTAGGGNHILAYGAHPQPGLTISVTAYDCSADGSTVVGETLNSIYNGIASIFSGGQTTLIPTPPQFDGGSATCVSADGHFVAGVFVDKNNFDNDRGFVYNGATKLFASPIGVGIIRIAGISNDGGTVAGMADQTTNPFGNQVPFVWTASGGTKFLKDYLTANGITVGVGITLDDVEGVSGDGLSFAGQWHGPNFTSGAYLATITPPKLTGLALFASAIIGGNKTTGTVTVDSTLGTTVALSSNSTVAKLQTTIGIPHGSASANFTIQTFGVAAATNVIISASHFGVTKTKLLIVNPASILSIGATPNPVVGGNLVKCTILFNGQTGPHGAVVNMASTNPGLAAVAATMPVAGFMASLAFPIQTKGVVAQSTVTISATYRGITKSTILTLKPASVLSLIPSPATVIGGGSFHANVYLNGLAGPGGFVFHFATTNNAVIPVPFSNFVIAAGSKSISVPLPTTGVAAPTAVKVSAEVGAIDVSGTVTVMPAALTTLAAYLPFLKGGGTDTISIRLNGKAPPAGASVALVSSAPAVIPVTTPIKVAGNTEGITFLVTTKAVTAPQMVTLTATYLGVSKTFVITVNP